MEEIWKDIESFEGYYQVSNFGRVRGVDRRNNIGSFVKGAILKQGTKYDGYKMVRLTKFNKGKTFSVHRIVAKAFIQNPDNLPEVDHLNGIRDDNRVENLRWCTRQENNSFPETRHNNSLAQKRRFMNPLERQKVISRTKQVHLLTEDGVVIRTFNSVREAGRTLNVAPSNISACCKGKIKQILGYKFKYANI